MPFRVEILVEMLAVGGVRCPGRGTRGRGGVPTALCLLTLTARVRTDHLGPHVGPEPSFEFEQFDHMGSQISSAPSPRSVSE